MRPGYWPAVGGPIQGDAEESQGGEGAADEAAEVLGSEDNWETEARARMARVDCLATTIETAPAYLPAFLWEALDQEVK